MEPGKEIEYTYFLGKEFMTRFLEQMKVTEIILFFLGILIVAGIVLYTIMEVCGDKRKDE